MGDPLWCVRARGTLSARAPKLSFLAAVFAIVGVACSAGGPPRTPEELCARVCESRAPRCSKDECARGCNLSLDRIVERETEHVVSCVAKQRACGLGEWAECATWVGPHADGGPLPPKPPGEDEDEP